MWLTTIALIFVVYCLFYIVGLLYVDCDLVLAFCEHYGKKISKYIMDNTNNVTIQYTSCQPV